MARVGNGARALYLKSAATEGKCYSTAQSTLMQGTDSMDAADPGGSGADLAQVGGHRGALDLRGWGEGVMDSDVARFYGPPFF